MGCSCWRAIEIGFTMDFGSGIEAIEYFELCLIQAIVLEPYDLGLEVELFGKIHRPSKKIKWVRNAQSSQK